MAFAPLVLAVIIGLIVGFARKGRLTSIAGARIVSIPLFIPTVLLMVLFPALSAAAAGNDDLAFNRLARRAILVVSLTTVPMAFGLIALTGNLIELFGYPDEFTNSIWPTMILATSLPLVGIDMMLGAILLIFVPYEQPEH